MVQKTRLSQGKRDIIFDWMRKEKIDTLKEHKKLISMFENICEEIHKIIQRTYSINDLEVLKKYGFLGQYSHYVFTDLKTGRVFGFDITYKYEELARPFIQVPKNTHGKVFETTKKLERLIDEYNAINTALTDTIKKKKSEYNPFLSACKYVEDVENVVPLPADLRQRLCGNTYAIIAINPEIVENITNDFK